MSLQHSTESTGGKFETVFNEYMTTAQVVDFFGVSVSSIEKYYKGGEHKDELEQAGLIKMSHSELKEMRENFVHTRSMDEKFDTTDSFKLNSQGTYLWHLKSVIRLGMSMTNMK